MSSDDEIDYDALDNISKKFDLVLGALENSKAVTVTNSVEPALKALKHELEDPKDGLNDPYLNSLIAQLMKAKDDEYLVDDHIKTYLRTFIQELADELRSVYSKVKVMEIGLQSSKNYQARKKIENDEDGVRVEAPPEVKQSVPDSEQKISASDKIKLVKAAFVNLPEGTRTTRSIRNYVANNYHLDLKPSTITYLCRRLKLGLEGVFPKKADVATANNEEEQANKGDATLAND